MNAIIKELSHDETLMVNGGVNTYYGGTLPEVVCVGHKKTFWDKILEYIQSVIGAQNINQADLGLTKEHL